MVKLVPLGEAPHQQNKMLTLDIGGREVEVDRSFLSLSPDKQNETVDEIAQSIGVSSQTPTSSIADIRAKYTPEQMKALASEELRKLKIKRMAKEELDRRRTPSVPIPIEKLHSALRNAHAAGDVAAAKKLANAIKAQSNQQPEQAPQRKQATLTAYEPSFLEGIGNSIYDAANSIGLPASRMRNEAQFVPAFVDGAAQGGSFNTSDEIFAGLSTGFGALGDYDKALDSERRRINQNAELHPKASLAGNLTGALALGGGMVKSGASLLPRLANANLTARVAGGSVEGAAYGGLYGAGGSIESERTEGALKGAGTGVVIGAAATPLLHGVRAGIRKFKGSGKPPDAPTVDELQQTAGQLYNQAFQAGVTVKPQVYKRHVYKLARDLRNIGVDRDINTGTIAALKRMSEAVNGQPMGLQELDILRRVAQNATSTPNKADAHSAHVIIDAIDDIVNKSSSFSYKNKAGVDLLREGRKIWHTSKKAETISELFRRADLAKADYGVALRNEFRTLARRKNGLRGFSGEEKRQITRFVRGGNIENFLAWSGKGIGGLVGTGISGTAGFGAGGPVGSIVALATSKGLSSGAKGISNRMTVNGANRIDDGIRRGQFPTNQRLPQLPAPLLPPLVAGESR